MAGIRAFVAVDVGPSVRERVAAWSRRLQQSQADFRWVDPRNYHLTLKFLGAVELRTLPEIGRVLAETARAFEPFPVTCSGLGCFPGWTSPRVLWVGVTEGQEELTHLALSVDRALAALGFPRETRDPRPHLTLARQRSPQGLDRLKEIAETLGTDETAGSFSVGELLLMESQLSAAGPTYRVRGRYPLGAGPVVDEAE